MTLYLDDLSLKVAEILIKELQENIFLGHQIQLSFTSCHKMFDLSFACLITPVVTATFQRCSTWYLYLYSSTTRVQIPGTCTRTCT